MNKNGIKCQGRTQDLELGGGRQWRIQDFSKGVLKVRPHTKSGGGGGGGGSPLQVLYAKSGGGGGGGGQSASGPIRKVGGGASPLQVRYLCLAHRKYLHVPTYVLPRYTSHARANDMPAKVNLL